MSRRLRTGSWGWFVALQLAAIVPVVVLGLSLREQIRTDQTEETLRDGRVRAALLADLSVRPLLPPGDLSAADPASVQPALDRLLSSQAVADQVLRIKIWDRDGRVVASDAAELAGQRFGVEKHVGQVLDGEVITEITRLQAAENATEREFGRAVEVYTPLRSLSGETVGVLEVYLPYEPLAAALADQQRALTRNLALGLAAVVVAVGLLTSLLTARLRRRTARAVHLSEHDELTGLLNRSAFQGRLLRLVAARHPAAVVVLDLDGFQRVNGALGHLGGDRLLVHTADVLCEHSDVVARLDGDEFALLVREPSDLSALLARLHADLSQDTLIDGVAIAPVASIGAALFPEHTDRPGELLRRAAVAVEVARRTRGTAVYAPEHDTFDPSQLLVLSDLRHAADRGELELHYQPQAAADTRRVVAVEALLRWRHPARGLLLPGDFLPLAEATGLVTHLTRWVLGESCRQLADWLADGLDVSVSVNISARDLADRTLPAAVAAAVASAGVPARRLILELTETAIVEDPITALAVLADLSAAGHELSLDDFGAGYTALGQLRDLPLSELKIDRSFVAGMQSHPADRAVVTTVITLAKALGLRIVAEGVETAEQAVLLSGLGCDVLQGWHIGRPVEAGEARGRLSSAVSL